MIRKMELYKHKTQHVDKSCGQYDGIRRENLNVVKKLLR
jgi:hypothetical protein